MTTSLKKTVMQVLPALNSGGVERGVIDISVAAAKAGYESIVISNGGSMIQQFNGTKVKHIKLPLASKNPLVIYSNIKRIAKVIEEYNVDLVHIRSRAPGWSAYFAWKQFSDKVKLISTVHGSYSTNLFNKTTSQIKLKYNAIMLKPRFIIAVSNFIKDYIYQNYSEVENLNDKKIKVIHRGVDLNYFSNSKVPSSRIIELTNKWALPDDKKIIMLPGRITGWKGHEFLISALAKVKNDNFFCIMVGATHGHEKFARELEAKIKQNNLEGKIKMVGSTKDMPAAYLVSDMVISSSVRPEAFGRVAIEAGAMGRIIIATNIGGSLETVVDGKTGFLVEVNNVDKLAATIDQVLSMSKNQKEEIEKNAIKHISENFSNKKMIDQTLELYKEILEN